MSMTAKTTSGQAANRRQFLAWAWGASLLGLFGQAGVALLQFFRPRLEAGAFGADVVAGTIEEFETGRVSFILRGRVYVSRLEDGGFLALWQRCTHLGCTVPWREDEGLFHCPCHSSLFNRRGEVIGGPAPRPLDLFPLRAEEGQLVVDTRQPIVRDRFDPSQVFHPS
ncbi:MAG: ubiquinol-cytochrome c reductase iron-sulfur subunit [Actinomycetota bacterium]